MRIILLHAPLGIISSSSEEDIIEKNAQFNENHLHNNNFALIPYFNYVPEDDFIVTPYGLFSIAAQALQAGHKVTIYNISTFTWDDICLLVHNVQADIFGLSCYTVNRWGVKAVAELIKEVHGKAYIVAGGPHASALPEETLRTMQAIDSIIIGEGEVTFLELVKKIEQGLPIKDIAGMAWRNQEHAGNTIEIGPNRPRIENLDSLASPLDYYDLTIILTSRGCPEQCTFCASPHLWKRKLSYNSEEHTLTKLEQAVKNKAFRIIMFKDDTFTVNKTRASNICKGIIQRDLNITWSCDTRVDSLDEDLLRLMRLAGCQRLSFGVESGAKQILHAIKKRTDPEQVVRITELCKKYGFNVRFYMMYGNREETMETIYQSMDLIHRAKPNQYVFAPLTILPGTEEYNLLLEKGDLSPEDYSNQDWNTLVACNAATADQQQEIFVYCYPHAVHYYNWDYTTEHYREILKLLPDLNMAYLDLGGSLLRDGMVDEAAFYINKAEEGRCPLGYIYNYRACIAAVKQDYVTMKALLDRAYAIYPHYVVMQNMHIINEWEQSNKTNQPQLIARHDFEVHLPMQQPELPGIIDL